MSDEERKAVRVELVAYLDGDYALDVNAPDVNIEYVLSILERAQRLVKDQMALLLAQQQGAAMQQAAMVQAQSAQRTSKILEGVNFRKM